MPACSTPDKDWTYLQERTFALIGPSATRDALDRFSEPGMRDGVAPGRATCWARPRRKSGSSCSRIRSGLLALVRDHFRRRSVVRGHRRQPAGIPLGRRPQPAGHRDAVADRRSTASSAGVCSIGWRPIEAEARPGCRERRPSAGAAGADRVRRRPPDRGRDRVDHQARGDAQQRDSVSAILLLLLVVFRSAWLFLVGAIPMAVATLGSIAINGLLRDQLSAAATGTSALLFGLGIDGLVLMYARYLEEIEGGVAAPAAIARLGGAGTSMLLGCLTTAATFFGLTWIDLPGLQELGRLVGVGMLLGGPLTLLLVAALLPARVKRPRGLVSGISSRGSCAGSGGPFSSAPLSRPPPPCRSLTKLDLDVRLAATAAGHAGRPAAAGDRTSASAWIATSRSRWLRGPHWTTLIASTRQFEARLQARRRACGSPARAACCPRSTNRPRRAGFWRPLRPTSRRSRRDCAPSPRTSGFDQARFDAFHREAAAPARS